MFQELFLILREKNLRIKYAADTRFHGNAMIQGLPDFFSSYMEAEIIEMSSTACDLRSFKIPAEEDHVDMTDLVECDEVFTAKGDFKGYYEDFITRLKLSSNEGIVDADVAFTRIENDTIYFNAKLKGDTVDIGRLLDVPLFGRVTMDVDVSGNGNDIDDILISGEGFFKSIDFMDYRYNLVGVHGWYQFDSLIADIRIGDKNLMMDADVNLKIDETPLLNVASRVKYANIEKLKFIDKYNLVVNGDLVLRMKGFDLDLMTGQIKLDSANMYLNGEKYWMEKAELIKK